MNLFHQDYARGMNFLYLVAPEFGHLAQALGTPYETTKVPTACVEWDKSSQRVRFSLNASFIRDLTDSELAATIAHETYHVVLEHLKEMNDPYYEKNEVLIDAQECIINDSLKGNIGVELPAIGAYYGTERYDEDFSYFTTKEGYDFILSKLDEEENADERGEGEGGGTSKGEQGSSAGTPADEETTGGCGGVRVSEEDAEAFSEAVKEAVKQAVERMGDFTALPDELQDSIGEAIELPQHASQGKGAGKTSFQKVYPTMAMNWLGLLRRINPKVNSSGRPKAEENWMRPPRNMISVYPSVVLPSLQQEAPQLKRKGSSLPTMLIALDLSGSIPRHLVKDLMTLVHNVPEQHIKALPVTWSDYVLPYDPKEGIVVPEGGTNINELLTYALELEKKLGTHPYVLVITDGACHLTSPRAAANLQKIKQRWSWCAIQDTDVRTIEYNFHQGPYGDYTRSDNIYKLSEFTG